MPVVILKPPVVYGPRDRDTLAFFRMIRRGYNVHVGAGESWVSMIYVSDLVDATLLAAQEDLESGSTVFVSDGTIHRWREVAQALARIMGVKVRGVRVPLLVGQGVALVSEVCSRLFGFPPLLNRQKIREIKQRRWTCEIDLARRSLGFEPAVPLEKGLKETYSWYLERGWI
jgi:nucleoside-diphosphate-sugar epimerase